MLALVNGLVRRESVGFCAVMAIHSSRLASACSTQLEMQGHVFRSGGVVFVVARWWWWWCVVVTVATEASADPEGATTADFTHVGRGSVDAVRALVERVLRPGAPASNPALKDDTMTPST